MKICNDLYNAEDIEKIHAASVMLLRDKGVHMPCERALEIFCKAGARVGGEVVYIEEDMLNKALSHCPSRFLMRARKSEHDFEIGGGKPCFCLPNGPVFVKKGEEYWSSQAQDVINFMKLSENSPTINMVPPWVTTANDVDTAKQLAYQLAVTLKYSTKPILGLTAGYEKSKFSIQLVRDFYNIHEDGQYVCLGLISPISPLSYDDRMLEAIVAYAEENQPLFFSSAVLPGATGPVTLAGALCDSKLVDAQAGIEATMVMLPTLLAGTDFILHGAGILDSYNIISYDKFLMDEEMTQMCLYMKEGVAVDEETFALDAIMEVEHGGQYLMEDHTFDNMHTALYHPKYLEKGYYAAWRDAGSHTAAQNAVAAVDKRLAAYQETPLTAEQEAMLAPYLNVFPGSI